MVLKTGKLLFVIAKMAIAGLLIGNFANAQNAITTTDTAPKPDALTLEAQKALDDAKAAKTALNTSLAASLWQTAIEKAPATNAGYKIALEATKQLGYYYRDLPTPDLRKSEANFAANGVLARKLFFAGDLSGKIFANSVKEWGTAAGLMFHKEESAALIFFASEIKARERAALSSQILNREAIFASDAIADIKVTANNYCATSYASYLAKIVTCAEEISARSEALATQARQIKADAPPPVKKEEKKENDGR